MQAWGGAWAFAAFGGAAGVICPLHYLFCRAGEGQGYGPGAGEGYGAGTGDGHGVAARKSSDTGQYIIV